MADLKRMLDKTGIIYESEKELPEEYKMRFLSVLAELENNECYKKREFPVSQLHKIEGIEGIYRAYVDKISGGRIHIKYNKKRQTVELVELLKPSEHDRGTQKKTMKKKKGYK